MILFLVNRFASPILSPPQFFPGTGLLEMLLDLFASEFEINDAGKHL